ncbi:MAG: PaaI family thioesterase, partial [Acidimicrobiales bacterium]|nr:PaaI family thioesterase [Acidimicrobiales bacterium]
RTATTRLRSPTVTPSPTFGLQEALGFTIESVDGEAIATLTVDDLHLNPHGVVHGAVPFTLMDTAMGGAVMSTIDDGRLCATIEMQTRFHRPVATGRLRATAKVTTAGRRIVHLTAETLDDDNRLVASATASFAVFEA